jgi:hypothetical protein
LLRKAISVAAAIASAGAALPLSAAAQLRPLDHADWRLIEGRGTFAARVGCSHLKDQQASLAGTSGALWEAGLFTLAWRTGRVVLEASGTAQRYFREEDVFAAAYDDVVPSDDGRRHDSGDYRIGTSVRLTAERSRITAAVRFGTRLPTTDNETGLDRDAVDFFGTVGLSGAVGRLALSAETGIGIHSTREVRFEQEDVLIYSLRAELPGYWVTPSIEAVGQRHGPSHAPIRGVEDLGELRAGLRLGNRYFVSVDAVKGYETFSPSAGLIVTAGLRR